jgi:hypothetical protein
MSSVLEKQPINSTEEPKKKENSFTTNIISIVKPRLLKLYDDDDWISNYIGIFFFLLSFIPLLNQFHPSPNIWIWKSSIKAYDFYNSIGILVMTLSIVVLMSIVIVIQKKIDLGTFLPGFVTLLGVVLFSQFLGSNNILSSYGSFKQ